MRRKNLMSELKLGSRQKTFLFCFEKLTWLLEQGNKSKVNLTKVEKRLKQGSTVTSGN
jgi:hypothetical protein